LWVDGAHDAPTNMARDAALLELAEAGTLGGPLLRLFTFSPPGITLGRGQDPASELDATAVARDGVRWAVRPTGGRAIWHEEEWTFSLVTSLDAEGWAVSPGEAYARTGQLFAAALARLGVPAELSPGSARGPGAPRSARGAAPPCFASTARHELVAEGRKLAGIAQRAVRGALLQQGSLLLGDAHAKLALYVRVAAAERERSRESLRESLRASAATAGRWLAGDRSLERLAGAIESELGESCERYAPEEAGRLGGPGLPRRSG
jgi:lipoate-protein ligase A